LVKNGCMNGNANRKTRGDGWKSARQVDERTGSNQEVPSIRETGDYAEK
jgi:hypothetical protein